MFKENQECILRPESENSRSACNHNFVDALNKIGETVTKYPNNWYAKGPGMLDENVSNLCRSVLFTTKWNHFKVIVLL